jgi:hypothetical protein
MTSDRNDFGSEGWEFEPLRVQVADFQRLRWVARKVWKRVGI